MEFETLMKMIVGVAAAFAIPVGAYAAVMATRTIWGRAPESDDRTRALVDEVEGLRARVDELEQAQVRMAELEERVDFTERLLTRAPDREAHEAGGQTG